MPLAVIHVHDLLCVAEPIPQRRCPWLVVLLVDIWRRCLKPLVSLQTGKAPVRGCRVSSRHRIQPHRGGEDGDRGSAHQTPGQPLGSTVGSRALPGSTGFSILPSCLALGTWCWLLTVFAAKSCARPSVKGLYCQFPRFNFWLISIFPTRKP